MIHYSWIMEQKYIKKQITLSAFLFVE